MSETWARTAECFDALSRMSSRKEMIKKLAEYFMPLTADDLIHAVYLAIARVSSESNGVEMNIGENILLKALSIFSTVSVNELRKRMKEKGDISTIVTVSSRPKLFFAKNKTLLLSTVFSKLEAISKITGKESAMKKTKAIAEILAQCTTNEEIKYIIRIIDGKMKIGLSTQTVLCSLGLSLLKSDLIGREHGKKITKTITTDITSEKNIREPEEETEDNSKIEWTDEENIVMDAVKEAYAQLPSFERIIKLLQKEGLLALSSSLITPGYPLRPMLAMAEKDPVTVASRFKEEYLVEYKYDGERVQAHFFNGKIELFSRGLESTTARFHQIIEPLKKANKTGSNFIIDGEIVAYCRSTSKILSFQTLSNRKRKITETNTGKEESDIALFAFDLIFLDRPLNKLPIKERKKILKESFQSIKGEIEIAESHEFYTDDIDRINRLFTESISAGCEGIMVKSADTHSTYEPSKRSQKWIKLKSDYVSGLYETLDLLVIGGYTGKGKRTGVYGGFLLGCTNELDELETVTKIGTGFSEATLEEISKDLDKHITSIPQADVSTGNQPDVWFKPIAVWEVAAAAVSVSPQYTAGLGSCDLPEGKGLSLRFPRFIRIRDDKTRETATKSEQVLRMFKNTQ